MSRLTGTDAYSLMEAYNAVYAPQELTEEQVWEEVETWVNSLVEEGYDLSDYTWEEMYESYIEEQGMDTFKAIRSAQQKPSPIFTKPIQKAPPLGQPGSGFQNTRPVLGMPTPALTVPPNRVGPGLVGNRVAGSATISNLYTNGTSSTNRNSAKPAATTARPAATTARPAAGAPAPRPVSAPARPATTAPATSKPAVGPTGKPLVGGIERRTPTSAELKAAQAARAGGGALAQATAAASKPAAFNPTPTTSTSTPSAKPATPAKPTPRQARLNMEMEYDTFDTVLEYLVAEGYADTNEAALVIMANMSEEWKQSIVTA